MILQKIICILGILLYYKCNGLFHVYLILLSNELCFIQASILRAAGRRNSNDDVNHFGARIVLNSFKSSWKQNALILRFSLYLAFSIQEAERFMSMICRTGLNQMVMGRTVPVQYQHLIRMSYRYYGISEATPYHTVLIQC